MLIHRCGWDSGVHALSNCSLVISVWNLSYSLNPLQDTSPPRLSVGEGLGSGENTKFIP